MNFFRDLTNDEVAFQEFKKKIKDDDEKLMKYFEEVDHYKFLCALAALGGLLDTINIYIDFIQPQIQEALKMDTQPMKRKINKLVKDLNDRIIVEYDFKEDVIIISEAVVYNGQLNLFLDKTYFVKTLDLKTLESL